MSPILSETFRGRQRIYVAGLSRCIRLGCAAVRTVGPLTVTIEIERVPLDLKCIDIGNHLLDILDTGVTEFHDLLTVQTNQMIMLPEKIRGLIFGLRITKLVAHHQITLQ